nr:type II secretion system protein GspC [Oceanococcus sp. HetDA_MAG_MS8]
MTWLLLPEGPAWTPPTPSSTAAQPAAQAGFSLDELLAAELFGPYRPQAQPEAAELDPEDAPDTKLRLTLRGIVAAETAQDSRALIESNPNDLEPYSIGMAIPGGATLHAIYPDRVLLRRAGRLETLRLEKDEPRDPNAVVALPPTSRGSAANVLDYETAQKLSNIRSELLQDPTKASQYMRMQPARRNGQLVGYRIYPGRNRELFREVGLRPGDIITSVNGVELNNPSRSLQLLGDLSQANNIDLTVERAGNLQNYSVTLNP